MHSEIVLFDLGGVLVCDPWESLLLSPGRGLADQLRLDRNKTEQAGRALWQRYSLAEYEEEEYWEELSVSLSTRIPEALVQELEGELLYKNQQAHQVLETAKSKGFRIGIISDNTSFWFPKQARLIDLGKYADQSIVFLSYRLGLHKDLERGGLFDVAASVIDPSSTLVVDDRAKNVCQAVQHGFRARLYSMYENATSLTPYLERRPEDSDSDQD